MGKSTGVKKSKEKYISEHDRILSLENFTARWEPVMIRLAEHFSILPEPNISFAGAGLGFLSASDWEKGIVDKCDENQEEIYFADGNGGCITVNIDIRNYGKGIIQPRYNGKDYGEPIKPPKGADEDYNSKTITIRCYGPHSVKLHSTKDNTKVRWRIR